MQWQNSQEKNSSLGEDSKEQTCHNPMCAQSKQERDSTRASRAKGVSFGQGAWLPCPQVSQGDTVGPDGCYPHIGFVSHLKNLKLKKSIILLAISK